MQYGNTDHDRTFFQEMAGANTLEVVLKAAVYVEHELLALMDVVLPNPEVLRKAGLDFSQRSALAVALGLNTRFHPPLKSLGNIRNKFAHRLNADLGDSESTSFYHAFVSEDRDMIHRNYEPL